MSAGVIFDISEAAVHDGPGLRTTVFLKGCPMRCRWCHSPEGQSPEPEILRLPDNSQRLCGKVYQAEYLAQYLRRCAALTPDGGITFSGGEVLMQADFVVELLSMLDGINLTVETSGAGDCQKLLDIAAKCQLIYFGLKIIDPADALRFTGMSSEPILENLFALDRCSQTKYILRIPLIPGAIASEKNFHDLMKLSFELKRLHSIEFLRANKLAPAKYACCQRNFPPEFADCRTGNIPDFFAPAQPFSILN